MATDQDRPGCVPGAGGAGVGGGSEGGRGEGEAGHRARQRPLRDFCTGAGWQPLPGAVLVGGTPDAPFPSDQPSFDKVTMARFFFATARRHRADFLTARIGLYPGAIDRLW
ncbi:hypothetical protein [Streptomyces sp. NPDC094472]|uniref:hypothetical protein n=1 Tax=unclassified Streptomyces TaxID=2593676 RepID=UPI00331D007D